MIAGQQPFKRSCEGRDNSENQFPLFGIMPYSYQERGARHDLP